ncbi:DUF1542 domain-containing protein [Streptococcus sp. Marseille-Q5855]|uniref:DUF1542 domain-containing protein n=2 Tax=Streptococcus TaxID=1301 RepID=UPI0021C8023D|nr:DUF1542 domain-containing protein [Streptococcus sp. Marseille-Q5855]
MKELHARVEAGLERAKAVLENPNSSQEEVNAQIQSMRELTEEVNKAMAGGVTSPAQLGEGRSVTQSEASPTPRRGRRGRGPLTPPATPAPVSTESQEKKETVEEATDYTNGPGSYPLLENIHKLFQELKTSTGNPEQVQKLKEAYDKLNEALQTQEDGLVDDAIFNAALEEYKKASHLKKGAEGAAKTRSRRSVSGLVYGLATGSPGNERILTHSDGSGKDSVTLLNSTDLTDAPLKFIATVQNGSIREFALTEFPDRDKNGNKWAETTVTYSRDKKRALITVKGKTPKEIYGLYNVKPVVTLSSGHVESRILQVRYQLPKAEFDLSPLGTGNTAQQDVEGKAKAKGNDRPVLKVKIPLPPNGSVDSKNIPSKGQLRVLLVRGGTNDNFNGVATSAKNYDIVAWTLISGNGTGYITPPRYLKETIGDQPLRLVTAYVWQNTNNPISEDVISPLSDASITPTNPIDRDGAKQTAEQKAQAKRESFNGIRHLTDEEKNAAIDKVNAALDKAKKAIDAAGNQRDIEAANQALDTELSQITPTAEANKAAKQTAEQKAQAKRESFNGIRHLTDEEKNAAIDKVNAALDKAKKAIDAAGNQRDIEAANQALDTELSQITPTAEANKAAKQTAEQKAQAKRESFNGIRHLTDEEKNAAIDKVNAALDKAKKAIDAAGNQRDIEAANQALDTELSQITPTAEANKAAKQTAEQKAQAKRESFNGIRHLTDEEKNAAIDKVNAALDKAKKAIDAAGNQRDIEAANQALDTELSQITPTAEANKAAKQTAEQKATDTLALINGDDNLSLFEKEEAKNQIRKSLQDALNSIDQAKTQAEIDQALQDALSSIDLALGQALGRANARRQSNQDKDQTRPSDQVENPEDKDGSQTPASTRNRRTPPRRSRRSVEFVGNSQTGTNPSAVDKSELQTLVEDLERRLQGLAALSPEALEEAQRILREAQAALANDSLTAKELAELLAKVREALNSLQAGTSADKSPSTSNSNKEAESTKGAKNETEVPLYGVLGAAVLSLLGALLFAVARKKSSQLDKLSRELHQLVVELEASDKDKKVLNKAKKLADEARLFVDSHQKDSQKEAELISEIKTVLSQLKEEV